MSDGAGLTDSSGTSLPSSLEGYFLVSETELNDPNFDHTVVLMINHNDEGAFGLVVNRPSGLILGDVIDDLKETEAADIPTYIGGPVEQHYLFTLHSGLPDSARSPYAASPVEGVVFEPVFQAVERYLSGAWAEKAADARESVCCYLGYSGWGPGQLESELDADAWLVIPATPQIVFYDDPDDGWNAALRSKGGLYEIIAKTGFKPSMN